MTDYSTHPSSGDDHLDAALLERYWLGESSPRDTEIVNAWLAAHPEWAARYERLRRGIQAYDTSGFSAADVDRTIAGVLERTRAHPDRVAPDGEDKLAGVHATASSWGIRSLRRWMSHDVGRLVAPAVLVIAAIVVYLGSRAGTAMRDAHARVAQYATRGGQWGTVSLRDGTRVTLAPRTTLSVVRSASGTTATLVGEAYFVVPHRTSDAFIVRTGRITTRVLGTTFDVRRYADDSATRVVVTEGKVSTGGARFQPVVPGIVAYVTDSTIHTSVASDAATLTGWAQGRLMFRNAPVGEVFSMIGQWYGVPIRLTDSALARQLLTVQLDTHRSQSGLLAALEAVLDVKITEAGDTLVVTPQRSHTSRATDRNAADASLTLRTEIGR